MILPDQRIIRPNAGFIIPTPRFLDVAMPRGNVGMSGRYQLIKRNAYGREIERTPWFDNIILDSGLNRWGTGAIIAGAAIGTGTSAPAASDTALQTQIHYTTGTGTGHLSVSAAGSSPYNNTITVVYRTVLGQLNGNYTEVGVGWASGSMFSRALVLDGGGSPTSISVSSTEQLDIVYQLSIYPPLTDTSNVVTISGVDYTVTGRASGVNQTSGAGSWAPANCVSSPVGATSILTWSNAWSGAIGAITSTPSGTSDNSGTSALIGSYSNNSLTRTVRHTYALNDGNISGNPIRCVRTLWSMCSFQYEYSPTIPKNNTKTLTLDFSVTWARRP